MHKGIPIRLSGQFKLGLERRKEKKKEGRKERKNKRKEK